MKKNVVITSLIIVILLLIFNIIIIKKNKKTTGYQRWQNRLKNSQSKILFSLHIIVGTYKNSGGLSFFAIDSLMIVFFQKQDGFYTGSFC